MEQKLASDMRTAVQKETMATTRGAYDPGIPPAEELKAQKPSELQADTAIISTSGKETEQTAPQEVPPAKLKLRLRNMHQPSASITPAPRRSLRNNIKNLAEQDNVATTNGAIPAKAKASRVRPPQYKYHEAPAVNASPQSSDGIVAVATAKAEKGLPQVTTNSTSAARGRNASANLKPGTAHDPIDVDSLTSPPPPHRFVHRNAKFYAPFPLQYKPTRPNMPPVLLTPNGAEILSGKVSGHESHDIYKTYMRGKGAPAPLRPGSLHLKSGADSAAGKFVSTGRAPILGTPPTQFNAHGHANSSMAGQTYGTPLQLHNQSYPHDFRAHTVSYYTPVNEYPIFPVLNEEQLRQRAVQLSLDHSRPHSRKRRLSDDPDATSCSEYEGEEHSRKKKCKSFLPKSRPETPPQPSTEAEMSTPSTPSTGVSEDGIFDRNMKLTELVEHTQLLSALLMTYPRSADQTELRGDIAMLAKVVDKRLETWVAGENIFEIDTRQRLASAPATSPNLDQSFKDYGKGGRSQEKGKEAGGPQTKGKDDDVRAYLSADSEVWGKGQTRGQKTAGGDGGVSGEKDELDRTDSVVGPRDVAAADHDAVAEQM